PLAFRRAAPVRANESTLLLHHALEGFVIVGHVGVRLTKSHRSVEQRLLHLREQRGGPLSCVRQSNLLLGARIASHQRYLIVLQVARANLQAQRHPLELPLVELPSWSLVGPVGFGANPAGSTLLEQLSDSP